MLYCACSNSYRGCSPFMLNSDLTVIWNVQLCKPQRSTCCLDPHAALRWSGALPVLGDLSASSPPSSTTHFLQPFIPDTKSNICSYCQCWINTRASLIMARATCWCCGGGEERAGGVDYASQCYRKCDRSAGDFHCLLLSDWHNGKSLRDGHWLCPQISLQVMGYIKAYFGMDQKARILW